MAAPNQVLVDRMAERGLIPISEAAQRYGHPRSTITSWIDRKEINGERVANFIFVSVASMDERTRPRAIGGQVADYETGGE